MSKNHSILDSYPIQHMVAAPLVAAIDAQTLMNVSYVNLLEKLTKDENMKLRNVEFPFRMPEYNRDGTLKGYVDSTLETPLVTISPLPNLAIETVHVEFDLRIDCHEESTHSTDTKTKDETKDQINIPVLKAVVAQKSSNVRLSDNSARYSFKIFAKKQEPPEGLMRILDILIQNASIPKKNSSTTPPT